MKDFFKLYLRRKLNFNRKLNPKPTEADFFQLIKSSTDSFYALQAPVPTADDKKQEDLLHGSSLYEQTSKSLEDLLKTVLDRDFNSSGLMTIFKHLEPWLTSVNDHERLRSIKSLSSVLKHFSANFKLSADDLERKPNLECFGHILGRIVSRSTDPIIQVRLITIDCIESLIRSLQIYNQSSVENDSEVLIELLGGVKQKLIKNDSSILLIGVNELSKLLCKKVPSGEQLMVFIEKLIDGLLDVQSHCSSASCIFLNYCVKLRGNELKCHVENLIKHLYTKLGLIQNPQAKLGTLRTIRILFQQHLIEALNVFLTFPIPCNK